MARVNNAGLKAITVTAAPGERARIVELQALLGDPSLSATVRRACDLLWSVLRLQEAGGEVLIREPGATSESVLPRLALPAFMRHPLMAPPAATADPTIDALLYAGQARQAAKAKAARHDRAPNAHHP